MTLDKALINKSYYEGLVQSNDGNSIQLLGELFMKEREEEDPELSSIRFAQGEVYFLNKDYEAAIFKWNAVENELKAWAVKNIGDAHMELDFLGLAEEDYKAIHTDSEVLKIEVLLQLFSLYLQLDKLDQAAEIIKEALVLNPDYPNVSKLARAFFEEHQDWGSAVDLAVNEAIRLEDLSWFDVLEGYIQHGHTAGIDPHYFNPSLTTLFGLDHSRFENITVALWKSYKETDLYFSWISEINQILLELKLEESVVWVELPKRLEETYLELISGTFLIKEVSNLVPNLLTNWLAVAQTTDSKLAASAIIAWNDLFPAELDELLVNEAELQFASSTGHEKGIDKAFTLYETVKHWAAEKDVALEKSAHWMVQELMDLDHYHLLMAGSVNSGASNLVNLLLHEELLNEMAQVDESFEDEAVSSDGDETNLENVSGEQALINYPIPASTLDHNKPTLLDCQGIIGQRHFTNHEQGYLHFADSLLYVLNANSQLTGKELDSVIKMSEQVPSLPIHFLLWKRGRVASLEVERDMIEKITSKINSHFPNAKVMVYSAHDDETDQLNEVSQFMRSLIKRSELQRERASKLLHFIKNTIDFLLEKRVEIENEIVETIDWNEEIITKLKGTYNQLSDMEEDKSRTFKKAFSKIKEDLRDTLMTGIPELLRNSSELVSEESDFRRLHVELNEQMNERITHYLEDTVLVDLYDNFERWIAHCENELRDSQTYLDDMSASFNQLYGKEKIALDCDFNILNDWGRDITRMTRGHLQLKTANILMRSTPSQLLLKGTGKLFGNIPKSKEKIMSYYKQFIENADYAEIAQSITEEFLQPFDIFEKGIEGDLSLFCANPYNVLDANRKEAEAAIEKNNETLNKMREKPEIYRDPLTLFTLKHRQLELMKLSGGETTRAV